jgi:hypothetical protein
MPNLRIENNLPVETTPTIFLCIDPGNNQIPISPSQSQNVSSFYIDKYSFNIEKNRTEGNVISFGLKNFTHGVELIDKVDTNSSSSNFVVRIAPIAPLGIVTNQSIPDILVKSYKTENPMVFEPLGRTVLEDVKFQIDSHLSNCNLKVNLNNFVFNVELRPSQMIEIINLGPYGYVEFEIQNYLGIGGHKWIFNSVDFPMKAIARSKDYSGGGKCTELKFEKSSTAPDDINISIEPD